MKHTKVKTFVCENKLKNLFLLHIVGFVRQNGVFDYSQNKNIIRCKSMDKNLKYSDEWIVVNGFEHISSHRLNHISLQNELHNFLDEKPNASVIFDFTVIPDINHNLIKFAKNVSNYPIRKHIRIAHYRIGLFDDDNIGFFWNSYLIRLLNKIKFSPSDCKCSQLKCFSRQSTRIKNKKALLLGGDGFRRLKFFNNLFLQKELNKTTWSLSKPSRCNLPICKFLPKTIDIPFNSTTKNRDITFPPKSIYKEHGYSIVHESVIQVESNYTSFFTEKIFKPIFHGHPFIHICVGHVWKILEKMGFKTMSPLIEPDGLSVKNIYECETTKYVQKVVKQMKHMEQASRRTWFHARKNAGYNRYVFQCTLENLLYQNMVKLWNKNSFSYI